MEWREHHLTVPFGWSVTHPGGTTPELEERVERLRGELEQCLRRVFSPADGFVVEADGVGDVWTATVSRREFRGDLAVHVDRGAGGAIRAVRAFGTGGSVWLPGIADRAERLARCCRAGGTALGVLVFAALCWCSVGVYNPAFVLGGLLMSVVMIMTLVGGANIGAWLAERVVRQRLARIERRAAADAGFQVDLRRWRALTRQLGSLRAALTGRRRHQPFRDEAGALTSPFASYPS